MNRLVLYDVCWNPCMDMQAMCRSFRFGQPKPVYVYRLLAVGTIEHKVFNQQVHKMGLSRRVVDESAIQRHFSERWVVEGSGADHPPLTEPPFLTSQ